MLEACILKKVPEPSQKNYANYVTIKQQLSYQKKGRVFSNQFLNGR